MLSARGTSGLLNHTGARVTDLRYPSFWCSVSHVPLTLPGFSLPCYPFPYYPPCFSPVLLSRVILSHVTLPNYSLLCYSPRLVFPEFFMLLLREGIESKATACSIPWRHSELPRLFPLVPRRLWQTESSPVTEGAQEVHVCWTSCSLCSLRATPRGAGGHPGSSPI